VTDTAAAEAPAESVPPEAAAAPAPQAELETEVNKSAREKVLDHLTDSEGPQTVAEIIQGTGLIRNTAEQAIFRAVQAEQLQRVSQGVYRLAPPKPLAPSGHTNDEWITRIEAWQANPASWNVERDGPPPSDPNHRIPLDVVGRFKDRQAREAKAAAKQAAADAEVAAAKQAADAVLRDKLIAATHGNFTLSSALDDVSPIRAALECDVPLDSILSSIRMRTDRRIFPANQPATSWRETRLLKKIAEDYCRDVIVPSMVEAWSKATAKVPATKTAMPADSLPDDIDELRSQHDSEHAPPGPHSLSKSPVDEDAIMALPAQPDGYPGGALEALSGAPAEPASALPDGKAPELAAAPAVPAPQHDDRKPVAAGREQILAAFARSRTPPQPAPQPQAPRPAPPQPRPQRQAEPEPISDEAWDEFCAGFRFGTFKWNVRRLGPEPGDPDCKVPRHILRRNGLA
jgi:hypothetical protein